VHASAIELAGVTIWAPVTAGTNVLLCMQCALYGRRLAPEREETRRSWGLFFAWMAVAAGGGALKHGFHPDLGPVALAAVHWVSTLAAGMAVWHAQRGPQLLAYLVANLALGPLVALMIINTAVGLLPVIFAEASRARRGAPGSAWLAGGLTVSALPALVYALHLSPASWLSHVDVAHVLMAVSYWLVLVGASSASPAR
jgi:hypothetical protein